MSCGVTSHSSEASLGGTSTPGTGVQMKMWTKCGVSGTTFVCGIFYSFYFPSLQVSEPLPTQHFLLLPCSVGGLIVHGRGQAAVLLGLEKVKVLYADVVLFQPPQCPSWGSNSQSKTRRESPFMFRYRTLAAKVAISLLNFLVKWVLPEQTAHRSHTS